MHKQGCLIAATGKSMAGAHSPAATVVPALNSLQPYAHTMSEAERRKICAMCFGCSRFASWLQHPHDMLCGLQPVWPSWLCSGTSHMCPFLALKRVELKAWPLGCVQGSGGVLACSCRIETLDMSGMLRASGTGTSQNGRSTKSKNASCLRSGSLLQKG